MFGTVKKILGIEGVKLELVIADEVSKDAGIITGFIKLTALSDANLIENITLKLTMNNKINIGKNDVIEIPFELEFIYVQSEMDKLESNNIFARGLVKFAKKLRNVKSEYTLRADAKIKGTTLSPFDIKPLKLV